MYYVNKCFSGMRETADHQKINFKYARNNWPPKKHSFITVTVSLITLYFHFSQIHTVLRVLIIWDILRVLIIWDILRVLIIWVFTVIFCNIHLQSVYFLFMKFILLRNIYYYFVTCKKLAHRNPSINPWGGLRLEY